MKKIFYLIIFGLLFSVIGIDDALGYSFVGITSNGVEIPIILQSNSLDDNAGEGDGSSMLDALGVSLAIQNIGTDANVYFGDGIKGKQTDIRPYVALDPDDDWVIVIDESDEVETLLVPEFGREYQYSFGSLIDVTSDIPNILGYSESESLQGTNSVYLDSDGIHVSGTGMRILKLNPMEGTNMIYRTNMTSGASAEIVESPNDLTSFSYDGSKFTLYSETVSSPSTTDTFVAGTYRCGYHPSQHYYIYCDYYAVNYSGVEGFPMVYVKGNVVDAVSSSYSGYTTVRSTSNSVPVPQDDNIQTSTVGDYTLIERFSKSYSVGGIPAYITASFTIKDTEPYTSELLSTANSETTYTMPSGDLYLIVKPNGGTVNIKGESFDPNSDVFFKVSGLPPDIAYDVSKSGVTGVLGKTGSDGIVSLLFNDVDFGVSTSPGAILKLYPDSIKHMGNFGTGMIDMYNEESISLSVGDDLAYIPERFVRWVFPTSVEITNLKVDDTHLNYLNNNYTKNTALVIPVIPSADTIYATINGTDIEVLMRDVKSDTLIKQVPQKSSSSSDHSSSGAVSASSNISTSTALTASHTGIMSINLDFKVAGNVEFTMDSSYTGGTTSSENCGWHGASSPHRTFSCKTYSTPNNPDGISNVCHRL